MKTTAFHIGKHKFGLTITEMSTPPFDAKTMAEKVGEIEKGSVVDVHDVDEDGTRFASVMWGNNCIIFIDANEAITGEWIAEIAHDVMTKVIGKLRPGTDTVN